MLYLPAFSWSSSPPSPPSPVGDRAYPHRPGGAPEVIGRDLVGARTRHCSEDVHSLRLDLGARSYSRSSDVFAAEPEALAAYDWFDAEFGVRVTGVRISSGQPIDGIWMLESMASKTEFCREPVVAEALVEHRVVARGVGVGRDPPADVDVARDELGISGCGCPSGRGSSTRGGAGGIADDVGRDEPSRNSSSCQTRSTKS
jgi:hypothetical protein